MRTRTRAALARSLAAIAVAAVAATACQTAARTAPAPVATSLVVRNPGPFDVNVYAIGEPAQSAWLGTIGAGRTGALPVPASALGAARALTVQARAVGASAAWISEPVAVLDGQAPVLDIVTNAAGICAGSMLYSVTTIDLEMFMR